MTNKAAVFRLFDHDDAEEVSALIRHTLRTASIREYSSEYIEALCQRMRAEDMIQRAAQGHFHVAEQDGTIIACGGIAYHWDDQKTSILLNIFVHPKQQKTGMGKAVVEKLEEDEIYRKTNKTVLHASISARTFYERLGYTAVTGQIEEDGTIFMEKFHAQ
ncbi:MAG: GNAT family N-acetyltransferase [Solobacterium sp.]|nr:GNAT family N-acetyltransferase [Solobacterium sp.]